MCKWPSPSTLLVHVNCLDRLHAENASKSGGNCELLRKRASLCKSRDAENMDFFVFMGYKKSPRKSNALNTCAVGKLNTCI